MMSSQRVWRGGVGSAVLLALVAWVGLAPAGSEEPRRGRDVDPRLERKVEKTVPRSVGGIRTSERDPVRELQGRLAQLEARVAELRDRADSLEQENEALASRLAALEGVVSVDSGGVTITTGGTLRLEAATLRSQAGVVHTNAATSTFSGVVKAETLLANTVSAQTMTPAAGNIW